MATQAPGVLLLMLAKPDYGGSLLIIGVAIMLGLAAALQLLRGQRVQEALAE